ncbi:G-protein coupled receptor 4-like [Parambassis ranga]|uniref:G-protein coupled receptor 4-like n=1 Tax=Parambassis ranga TaxID=210632 RepID=A0A6P7JSC2_9TELE|nr:G-protein coupled receptor 4-like [Parambassis ranga]
MEEFNSSYYSNETYCNYADYSIIHGCLNGKIGFIMYVVTWIVLCVGLPLIFMAIVAVYFLVRKGHIAPIYVLNLFISDLIQLSCMIVWVSDNKASMVYDVFDCIYIFGVMVSTGFMVCVSLERYLVIAHPLWYRYRRTVKAPALVCIVVWVLPLVYVLPLYFQVDFHIRETIYAILCLLPLPLFMFFLVGTLRALSSARSVPSDEKRRIVAILVVVLLIYTMLFLPSIIWSLTDGTKANCIFSCGTIILLQLSPLADLTMYVFIRKGVIDNLLSSLCCDRMDSDADTQHE